MDHGRAEKVKAAPGSPYLESQCEPKARIQPNFVISGNVTMSTEHTGYLDDTRRNQHVCSGPTRGHKACLPGSETATSRGWDAGIYLNDTSCHYSDIHLARMFKLTTCVPITHVFTFTIEWNRFFLSLSDRLWSIKSVGMTNGACQS